ncbi:HNH endonuclease signature motif containing protein [Mycolicibacterium aurum]|uniref:HNH endonuclease signature motif containing protein n=2 Tax=Mycolicibacterium aurum TaxID=1791 RepID=UPI000F83FEF2|nr:HNH endonuclease signature motif containing protein [Mycolicibacterium aurum]
MSLAATSLGPKERLEVLFEELSELAGQRNAIDGRIVDIVSELDGARLWGMTGAKSIASLVAWKLGISPRNAETIVAVADRAEQFPRCTTGLRQGWLSLDQVGVIAERAGDGSDDHYVGLARYATVTQLRTAVAQELPPEPDPTPEEDDEEDDDEVGDVAVDPGASDGSITKISEAGFTTWRIRLANSEAAAFDAALSAHRDALIAEWKDDHRIESRDDAQVPPFPSTMEAFTRLVESSWDAEATRRPHGQHTTVVVHVDVETKVGALHLGPVLTDEQRRYLSCDATCEVWFQRHGQVIGAGRATRTVNRRLRRALEHRDRACVVPGCGATRGLHAHHLIHWEDGGPTALDNLVLVCPFHHRAHHRGIITLTGPAHTLVVADARGRPLSGASLARPPTTQPPRVPPYRGPTGERAQWKWYHPFKAPPPTTN